MCKHAWIPIISGNDVHVQGVEQAVLYTPRKNGVGMNKAN